MPGQADDSVTVFLGYGRGRAGRVGTRAGYNGYALRTADRPYFDGGLELVKTGDRYNVASTQTHHTMAGRDLIHSATNARFLKDQTLFRGEEKTGARGRRVVALSRLGVHWLPLGNGDRSQCLHRLQRVCSRVRG